MSGYDQGKRFTVVAELRRKWTLAEKTSVVSEIAGSSVSAVARKHGIAASLLFRWRRELGLGSEKAKRDAGTAFVAVALPAPAAAPVAVAVPGGGLIEIELAHGRKLRVDASVDVNALKRVIAVLDGR
jgi:transposase